MPRLREVMTQMSRRIGTRLVLPLLALLLGFSLTEIGLRLAGITYPIFDYYDQERALKLKPGKAGYYAKEGSAHLKINSLGYRDLEHRLQKAAGTFRVDVLGDSLAEARQVSIEDTFWAYLGRHLGQCSALMGNEVEILNFDVAGYAVTEELFTLRKDVLRFSPDLVLLAFLPGNDIHENSRELRERAGWRIPKPIHVFVDGQMVVDNSFRQATLRRLLYAEQCLYAWVQEMCAKVLGGS